MEPWEPSREEMEAAIKAMMESLEKLSAKVEELRPVFEPVIKEENNHGE